MSAADREPFPTFHPRPLLQPADPHDQPRTITVRSKARAAALLGRTQIRTSSPALSPPTAAGVKQPTRRILTELTDGLSNDTYINPHHEPQTPSMDDDLGCRIFVGTRPP